MTDENEEFQDTAIVHFDPNEALVLFELLSRWAESGNENTPAATCFESTAEGAVLHGLLTDLERQLVAPFKPNYRDLLKDAQRSLEDLWDYRKLNGD